ncbi:MAG: HEAT repeat domain-containing protein [Candidatus Omnitrophota bacterium]
MKKIISAVFLVFFIAGAFYFNVKLGYAGPSLPQSDIPTDISDELKQAIEALYLPGEDGQIEALRRLGEMGDAASVSVPFIINMMSDASWKIRAAAVKALGAIGSANAVDSLINALKDENDTVQYNAAIALGKIKDPKSTDPLLEVLSSSSKYVRQYSAEALGELRDANTAKYLLNLLNDAEADVRASAAKALGKIGNKGAINFIAPLLNDLKPSVRYAAAEALAALCDLPENLREPAINLYSKDMAEQSKAVQYLASIDSIDPSLVPLLGGLLEENGIIGKKAAEVLANVGKPAVKYLIGNVKSDNDKARENAILALGYIKDPSAVKPLTESLGDNTKAVRIAAEKALVSIGQPAVEDLINCLKDERADVYSGAKRALVCIGQPAVEDLINSLNNKIDKARIYAVEALGEIKDASSVEPLIKALSDSNPDVRASAASALGKLGDTKAVDPLIAAIKDSAWKVRMNAVEALGKLGSQRAGEPLIAAMKDIKTEVRIKIVDALGEIKYDKAIEYLVGVLNDSNRDIQLHTADALSKITGESFGRDISRWKKWREEYLLSKLLDYKAKVEVKVMALELLQETKNPDYIETLFLVLKRDKLKPEVMENAADALRKITGEDFGRDGDAWEKWWRRDFIAGLEDSDRGKRVRTAKRLGELRSRVAIEPLIKKLKDTFADMREAVAESLRQITGQNFIADAATWEYWWEENKMTFQRSF